MRWTWERCPCGDQYCSDWHMKGFGKFVQGSGFSPEEMRYLDEAASFYEAQVQQRPLVSVGGLSFAILAGSLIWLGIGTALYYFFW